MMYNPVSYAGLVNIARFRIIYLKMLIFTVPVCFRNQITLKGDQISYEPQLKLLNVFFLCFALNKNSP